MRHVAREAAKGKRAKTYASSGYVTLLAENRLKELAKEMG